MVKIVTEPLVISLFQARPLLDARKKGLDFSVSSPDLGVSKVRVELNAEGVVFPGHEPLSWEELEAAARAETSCFMRGDDGLLVKIQDFSEKTGRPVSLFPTAGAPTVLVAGRSMHRIKGTDPWADTVQKIKAVGAGTGRVLDTCTGLGYTAILAARTAASVDTVEFDPVVSDVALFNPWSRELFDNPKIARHFGDSFDVIDEFPDGAFSRIIHDPPEFALAGHLYSLEFHRRLFRALAKGGRLFHYIGNPESASGKRNTAGVIKRLKEAGFISVVEAKAAFGVSARKGG